MQEMRELLSDGSNKNGLTQPVFFAEGQTEIEEGA
jgi:hypothetical protein